jgi:serine 3-dehydrogenase (NADP+)
MITGATSGIGAAFVSRLARDGFDLVLVARDRGRLDTAAADARETGVVVEVLPADLALAAGRDQISARLADPDVAPIDLLVNNAGLALGTAPAQQADLAQWKQMIDTNVTALVTLTHLLLPQLIERRGAIVNISSIAGSYAYRGGNVYGGTKAFVTQFSQNLRSDLHGTGVRVTSVEPGMAETEFTLVRTGGDQAASEKLYAGAQPITAGDIADTIWWIANLPPHLNINRLEVMPVSQSAAGLQVARDS